LGRDATDEALVRAVRDGSRQAWSELFSRHAADAWRVAYAVVRDRGLAEDVVQDAFVNLLRGEDRIDPDRPFRHLLLRVTANRAVDVVRHERHSYPAPAEELPAIGADGDPVDSDDETRAAVLALDPDQRLLVVLRYWLDLSPADIAARLGIPVGTVWSRLSRTLDQLRPGLEVADRA
jgi:RNA polymerase sigma-70 factor (ECF subfamily)